MYFKWENSHILSYYKVLRQKMYDCQFCDEHLATITRMSLQLKEFADTIDAQESIIDRLCDEILELRKELSRV